MTDESTTATGLSRRDMLRRSALVGGTMVWMAPAVQTLASPAFANGSPVQELPCLFNFFLKFAPTEGFDNSEGTGNANCVPPGPFEKPQISNQNTAGNTSSATLKRQDGSQLGSVTATYNPISGCVTISISGFTIDGSSSYYFIKDGAGKGCEVTDDGTFSDVDAADGTVSACDTDGDGINLSHINFVFCVTTNP